MILHRLATALRKQDWFTVLIETLIVVFGVFIGLQVNNWNAARYDRMLEQQYLERLFDDANATIVDFNAAAGWEATQMAQRFTTLEALRRGSFAPDQRETIAEGLALVGLTNAVKPRWGTVEELQATGNIALIRDVELRQMIADTEFYYTRSLSITEPRAEQLIDLRSLIMRRLDLRRYNHIGGSVGVEAEFDFDALAADDEFIAVLAEALFAQDIIYSFAAGNTRRMETMREYLAEELGKDTAALPTTRDLTQTWPWRIDPVAAE